VLTEVHQGSDKYQHLENERSHIGQRHDEEGEDRTGGRVGERVSSQCQVQYMRVWRNSGGVMVDGGWWMVEDGKSGRFP
jgi:hypothetical protein